MRRPAAWTRPLLLRLLGVWGGLSRWRILLRGRIDSLWNLRRSVLVAGRQILIFRRWRRRLRLIRSRYRLSVRSRLLGFWLDDGVVTAAPHDPPAPPTLLLAPRPHL